MKVAFFDLQKQFKTIETEVKEKIMEVVESGWYILGKQGEEFEKEYADFLGIKHCIAVNSGTDALSIALEALDIKAGDEVITTSNTFIATVLAISKVGAIPVFVDVDENHQMDIEEVKNKITPKTKAILVVHLYGLTGKIDQLGALAKENKLFLIEDACQAHGALYQGKRLGTFGDISCFSFYPTKNLGAYGDGGAIVTNSSLLAKKSQLLRNYGQVVKYHHESIGINSRLDEIQAGILLLKLKYLEDWNKARRMLAQRYVDGLASVDQIILPQIIEGLEPVFHQFVIRTKRRDQLKEYLAKEGIDTMIHYPIPIHKQKAYKEYNHLYLPKTEQIVSEILSLPIYPEMKDDEIDYVIGKIKDFYEK